MLTNQEISSFNPMYFKGIIIMKPIIFVILSASLCTPAIAQDRPSAQERINIYYTCVESKAVELGKKNTEQVNTILRAAYSECEFEHGMASLAQINRDLEAGIVPRDAETARKEARLREVAGDRASAALLRARVSK
jgi:hypothetical protein